MHRKIVAVWLSLAMVFGLIIFIVEIAPTVQAPTTLYVGGTGGGNYSKIQWAIDNASAGDTVFVYNGTYYENLIVNKTINLTGENINNTIIDGGNEKDVIWISADWVNVTELLITRLGSAGNYVGIRVDSAYNTFSHINFSLNNKYGIYLNNTNGNNIIDNIYSGNSGGCYLYFSSQNNISNNTDLGHYNEIKLYYSSENNITFNNGFGIRSDYSHSNYFGNNNASEHSFAGFYIEHSNKNIFINNKIHSNPARGIYFRFAEENEVIGNNISNNWEGICLYASLYNNITGNNLSDNEYGLKYDYSDNNNLINNIIANNEYGVFLRYSNWNNISNNYLFMSEYAGVQLSRSIGETISNNTMIGDGIYIVADSREYCDTHNIDISNTVNGKPVYYWKNTIGGIIPPGAGEVILVNCTDINIVGQELTNGTVGIEIFYSSRINISGNNASNNGYHGMYIYRGDEINISVNFVLNNMYGMMISVTKNSKILGNIVSINKMSGIITGLSQKIDVMGNTVMNNEYGFYMWEGCCYFNITGNTFSSNKKDGMWLSNSPYNNINNNILNFNDRYGLYLGSSSGNNITYNTMAEDGIFIDGYLLEHWNLHEIDTSNTVNGKPVYYWKNASGGIVPSGAGQVILANSSDIQIENMEITNTSVGIQLGFSSYIDIIKNNASFNNMYGISLAYSNNTNITKNDVYGNLEDGIFLKYSFLNNITANNVSLNHINGMYLYYYSDENLIIDNNVTLNKNCGIFVGGSKLNNIIGNEVTSNHTYGISIEGGLYNNVIGNDVSKNTNGIFLYSSRYNNITRNTVYNNSNGIYNGVSTTYNNCIYHNNILNNTDSATDNSTNGNLWDDGYPMGGNFWSDYNGVDEFKGPNQDINGSDGIGDTPYVIDSNSQDNYPLMQPYPYSPLENYTVLAKGWNLISIPLIQGNQSINKVLEMIEGYYDAVQWFDINDSGDPWKHHKINKSFGNDLSELNETMSFWIHITQPGDTLFVYNGTQPTSNQTIQLYKGWNMVGYPSLSNHNRTEGLNNLEFGIDVDAIQWFDGETKTWNFMDPDDSFVPGRGYWVHSKVEVGWEVPL